MPRLYASSRNAALTVLAALLPLGSGCTRSVAKAPTPSQVGAPSATFFTERAEQSGLATFKHTDGGIGRKYFVEQMGGGVAIFDFDNDGNQDVYFCTGTALPGYKERVPGNRLFRNRGDGSFQDVTDAAGVALGRFSIGAAVADYDNDGDIDLYVTCFGPNCLYRNNGNGTFTDVTKTAGVGETRLSSSAAWGDYDSDGFTDLFVANYVQYQIKKDLFCSSIAGQKSYCGPTLYERDVCTLYRNKGDGTFQDVSITSGIRASRGNSLGVIWLDYNGDGKRDLFVANDQSPNFLWENRGGGKFTERAIEMGVAFGEEGNARAGMGVDSADYDNDGRPDLIVTNFSEESNALYHNEGSMFRDVAFPTGIGPATAMFLGFGTGFFDYDRDGWQDLFFANGHVLDDIAMHSDAVTWAQPMQLFHNKLGKHFEDVSNEAGFDRGKWVGRGAAFGDLDNDGRTDILVNVLRGKPLYLHNEAAPEAHWLGLRLRPASGNALALDATVTVKSGTLTQKRDVRSSASYASSNDTRLVFGLGPATKVDELSIHWPSGKQTRMSSPDIDRYLEVTE